jgi:hypothetical protein
MAAGAVSHICLIWTHCTVHAAGETRLEKHDDLDYDVYHHLWCADQSRMMTAVCIINDAIIFLLQLQAFSHFVPAGTTARASTVSMTLRRCAATSRASASPSARTWAL